MEKNVCYVLLTILHLEVQFYCCLFFFQRLEILEVEEMGNALSASVWYKDIWMSVAMISEIWEN